jgi:hypothetical protein
MNKYRLADININKIKYIICKSFEVCTVAKVRILVFSVMRFHNLVIRHHFYTEDGGCCGIDLTHQMTQKCDNYLRSIIRNCVQYPFAIVWLRGDLTAKAQWLLYVPSALA